MSSLSGLGRSARRPCGRWPGVASRRLGSTATIRRTPSARATARAASCARRSARARTMSPWRAARWRCGANWRRRAARGCSSRPACWSSVRLEDLPRATTASPTFCAGPSPRRHVSPSRTISSIRRRRVAAIPPCGSARPRRSISNRARASSGPSAASPRASRRPRAMAPRSAWASASAPSRPAPPASPS